MGIIVLIAMALAILAGIYFFITDHQMKYVLSFEYTIADENVGTWKVISQNGFLQRRCLQKSINDRPGRHCLFHSTLISTNILFAMDTLLIK